MTENSLKYIYFWIKTIVIYELRIRITEEKFRTQVCFLIKRIWHLNFDRVAGDWYL